MKNIIKSYIPLIITTIIVFGLIVSVHVIKDSNLRSVQARAAQTEKFNKKQINYYRQKDQKLSKQYFLSLIHISEPTRPY